MLLVAGGMLAPFGGLVHCCKHTARCGLADNCSVAAAGCVSPLAEAASNGANGNGGGASSREQLLAEQQAASGATASGGQPPAADALVAAVAAAAAAAELPFAAEEPQPEARQEVSQCSSLPRFSPVLAAAGQGLGSAHSAPGSSPCCTAAF
jgi:hypothetical protein